MNSKLNITPEECRKNLKHNHTTVPSQYLNSRKRITNTIPYDIHLLEHILPCHMRTKLARLRANKSPLFQRYLHTVTLKLKCHNAQYACHTHMTLITSLTVVKYQHNTIQHH